MVPYVGIVTKTATTMTDLESAAAPSESVDTVIQCPTADLMHRQSAYAKITPKPIQNSANLPWGHPSTQIYVRPQDDPIVESTMGYAITEPHNIDGWITHPPQHTTKGIHHKIGAINVTGTTAVSHLLSESTTSDNDPSDGNISTPPATTANPRVTISAPTHPQPCTDPFLSVAPVQPPDTLTIISMQLSYIEDYIRALQSGSTLPTLPTELQQRQDNQTTPKALAGTEPHPQETQTPGFINSEHAPLDTTQCTKAPPHAQGVDHPIHHLCIPNCDLNTPNQRCPPNRIIHDPTNLSPQHSLPANTEWNPAVVPHNDATFPTTHSVPTTHAKHPLAPAPPTFAQWCAQNVTLTHQTHQIIANRKMFDFLLLIAPGDIPFRIRKKHDPRPGTNSYYYKYNVAHAQYQSVLHVKIHTPICHLPINSTQRRHHVRFRTTPHKALQRCILKNILCTGTDPHDTHTHALQPTLSTRHPPTNSIFGALLIFRCSQRITQDLRPP